MAVLSEEGRLYLARMADDGRGGCVSQDDGWVADDGTGTADESGSWLRASPSGSTLLRARAASGIGEIWALENDECSRGQLRRQCQVLAAEGPCGSPARIEDAVLATVPSEGNAAAGSAAAVRVDVVFGGRCLGAPVFPRIGVLVVGGQGEILQHHWTQRYP